MTISYTRWSLRGVTEVDVWLVYVEIRDSNNIRQLIEARHKLNNPPVTGLVLAENRSRALERLGWEKLDDGVWYKIFD